MLTVNKLMRFVADLKGKRIQTAGGRAFFRVHQTPDGVCYTVESSGKPRKQKMERIEKILARYNETKSFKPSVYADLTRHSSYAVGLIKECETNSR